jgi:hypothetical protein
MEVAEIGAPPFGVGKTVIHGMRTEVEGCGFGSQQRSPLMNMVSMNRSDRQPIMRAKDITKVARRFRCEFGAIGDDRASVVGYTKKGVFDSARPMLRGKPDKWNEEAKIAAAVPAGDHKRRCTMCRRNVAIEGSKPVRVLEGRGPRLGEKPVVFHRTEIETVGRLEVD